MMNSESASDTVVLLATPAPCYRAMPTASLEPGTPANLAGSLFTLLLALPRALVLAPALIRRRV